MELNDTSDGPGMMANVQEKKMKYYPDAFNIEVTRIVKYHKTFFFSLATSIHTCVLLLAKKIIIFTKISHIFEVHMKMYFYFICKVLKN